MDLTTRPVPGFTLYEISDTGEAFGQRGQKLKLDRIKGGYLRFRPMVNGKMHMMLVHRAVLLAFEGDPPDDERIFACHRDGDSQHNWIGNLYWGTYEDNWADRIKHGNDGRGSKNGRSKVTMDMAIELRRRYATGNYTYVQLARMFGISPSQANKIGRELYWPTPF